MERFLEDGTTVEFKTGRNYGTEQVIVATLTGNKIVFHDRSRDIDGEITLTDTEIGWLFTKFDLQDSVLTNYDNGRYVPISFRFGKDI